MRCKIKPVQQEIIWKWPKCFEDQLCEDLWPLTSETFHPNSKVFIKRLSASAICSSTPDKSSIFPPERSDRRPARLQGRQATNLDACAAPAPAVRTTHVSGLPIQIQLGAQSPCLTSELPVLCRAAAGACFWQHRRQLYFNRELNSSFPGKSVEERRINVLSETSVGLRRGDNARQATYSCPSMPAVHKQEMRSCGEGSIETAITSCEHALRALGLPQNMCSAWCMLGVLYSFTHL